MSMESLPLLQQAPPPEQEPPVKQSTDPAPDSKNAPADTSKQDLDTAPPGPVGSAGAHADHLHAATATADTLGMSVTQENIGLTAATREISFLPVLALLCAWQTYISCVMQSNMACS